MKHFFSPWSDDHSLLGGLFKISLQPGDAYTKCVRCDVPVKVPAGMTSKKFWVNGAWTSKNPPCKK